MKYEQENNRTYAVIENEYETQDCEYEQKMLQKNTIAGLLKMQTRRINNRYEHTLSLPQQGSGSVQDR